MIKFKFVHMNKFACIIINFLFNNQYFELEFEVKKYMNLHKLESNLFKNSKR